MHDGYDRNCCINLEDKYEIKHYVAENNFYDPGQSFKSVWCTLKFKQRILYFHFFQITFIETLKCSNAHWFILLLSPWSSSTSLFGHLTFTFISGPIHLQSFLDHWHNISLKLWWEYWYSFKGFQIAEEESIWNMSNHKFIEAILYRICIMLI